MVSSTPVLRVTFSDRNEVASEEVDGCKYCKLLLRVTYSQLGEKIQQRRSEGLKVHFTETSSVQKTTLPDLMHSPYKEIYTTEQSLNR